MQPWSQLLNEVLNASGTDKCNSLKSHCDLTSHYGLTEHLWDRHVQLSEIPLLQPTKTLLNIPGTVLSNFLKTHYYSPLWPYWTSLGQSCPTLWNPIITAHYGLTEHPWDSPVQLFEIPLYKPLWPYWTSLGQSCPTLWNPTIQATAALLNISGTVLSNSLKSHHYSQLRPYILCLLEHIYKCTDCTISSLMIPKYTATGQFPLCVHINFCVQPTEAGRLAPCKAASAMHANVDSTQDRLIFTVLHKPGARPTATKSISLYELVLFRSFQTQHDTHNEVPITIWTGPV